MINPRAFKMLALAVLAVSIISLVYSQGFAFVPGLEQEIFGFKMRIVIAIALGWVAWIFHRFSSV